MHEVGITEDLIESIEDLIKGRKDMQEIKKVYIRLGSSAALSEEALRFWFGQLSRGTKLEGAALDFFPIEGKEITVDSLEIE